MSQRNRPRQLELPVLGNVNAPAKRSPSTGQAGNDQAKSDGSPLEATRADHSIYRAISENYYRTSK